MPILKIFWKEIIPNWAIDQINSAMNNDFVVSAALMPDSHEWYSLPIWWVIATKNTVVPAWVGYDIWCWMCAINTWLKRLDIEWKEKNIFDEIYKTIPVSHWEYNKFDQEVDLLSIEKTEFAKKIIKNFQWLKQIWTLGWWNHFIEIDSD